MSLYEIILYSFEFLAAASAIALVLTRNVFYAALLTVICLLSLAALYVLAFAEFVAVTQILVYAGGVLVVIIFGIMLTAKMGVTPLRVTHGNIFTGLVLAVPMLAMLCYYFLSLTFAEGVNSPLEKHPQNIQTIGINLMSEHVLVFEIAGVLLLIALIGAAVVASQKQQSET